MPMTLRNGRGHFLPGASGNPRGRPRGSKNRYSRRPADRGRAAKWTRHDWAVFYRRTFHETDGDAGKKHAAAFSECIALWLLLHPAIQDGGLCPQCDKPLDLPMSTLNGAPIRVDGAWLHWGCLSSFLYARRNAARAGLRQFGIRV
jgi:hypothetical protein